MALHAGYYGIKRFLRNKLETIAGTYDETIKSLFPRSEQAVLGAKQLLDISKAVYGSLTFSTSEQGRVVNFSYGTAAAWTTVKCRFATKPNTNYRISTKATSVTGAVALKIQVPVSETNIKTSSFYTEPADFDFDFNSGNNSELELVLFGTNGTASVCNVTYEDLLITLGTDTDRTFAPYAMTNKELTDSAADQKTAINAIINAATGAADFAAFKTAMGAITPVTRSLSLTKEDITEEVKEDVEPEKTVTKKRTTKKTEEV